MDGRDLVRSVKAVGMAGPSRGLRVLRAAWRRQRADAAGLPARGAERARVPGTATGAEPGPGGGVVRFARSELRIVVTLSGAVFWGWDGAGPEPSYALVESAAEPDPRAVLESGKDGGWQVVAERVTVVVSRHGAIEVHTPGGVMLRHDRPPRWFEPVGGGGARWVQRSEVAADARFFGLGARASGPRLRDGSYRLWNTGPQAAPRADAGHGGPLSITMPLHLVVADVGTHLVFHDTPWDGTVVLREGVEGAGSGHDRAGACELRVDGGPLRCWVALGSPARVLHTWAVLTGSPTLPPGWAPGHHHALRGPVSEQQVRRIVEGHRARGLALDAVHLDIGPADTGPADSGPLDSGPGGPGEDPPAGNPGQERLRWLPPLTKKLAEDGVRLVSEIVPAVRAQRGDPLFAGGRQADAFVRDRAGRPVRGESPAGESVYPDFTDGRVRAWWGEQYRERLEQGFAGFRHDEDEPASSAVFGGQTLPRSAVHSLDGRGGDHRAAHNVYGLSMARAAHEALRRLRPADRPFLVSRSGWAGMQRYTGVCSPGTATGWPGLRASLSVVLGLGLCGVPLVGVDVDGDAAHRYPELYVRGLQLASYLPLLRTRSSSETAAREETAAHEVGHIRAALVERGRLLPYFMTLAQLAHRTGAPWVRPLWWGSPEDRVLRDCEDAFLLGDSLLVAPVLEPGTDRRAVRLPRGRWYDTVTEKAYEGPGQVLLDAPLSRIPVLARGGAVVPVRAESGGGMVLEVWAPARGRSGGGLVVEDAGDGWELPVIERYTSLRAGGRVIVERAPERVQDGPRAPGRPVRVRGL